MKKLFILILCFFLIGCGTKDKVKKTTPLDKEDLTIEEFREYFLVINALHEGNLLYTSGVPSNYVITNKNDEITLYYKINGIGIAELYDNINKELTYYSLIDWTKSSEIDNIATKIIFHYCNTTFDEIDKIKNNNDKNSRYRLGSCVVSKTTDGTYSYDIHIE